MHLEPRVVLGVLEDCQHAKDTAIRSARLGHFRSQTMDLLDLHGKIRQ